MSVATEAVYKLDIFYDAGENVPPPFHYAYHLELVLKEDQLKTAFDIRYLHREELSEDEILEEGFTLNDDWRWEGTLPQVWLATLKEQLQKSMWPNKPKEGQEGEPVLDLQLFSQAGEMLFTGRPADVQSWEYFLQEMIQAVYEVAQKEAPLSLHYKEVIPGRDNIDIWLEASFASRQATLKQEGLTGMDASRKLSWPALKKLLKDVYMPEYDYDNASEEVPKWPGRYLSTGEGLWFAFGENLLEPGVNTNSLDRLEQAFKSPFSAK